MPELAARIAPPVDGAAAGSAGLWLVSPRSTTCCGGSAGLLRAELDVGTRWDVEAAVGGEDELDARLTGVAGAARGLRCRGDRYRGRQRRVRCPVERRPADDGGAGGGGDVQLPRRGCGVPEVEVVGAGLEPDDASGARAVQRGLQRRPGQVGAWGEGDDPCLGGAGRQGPDHRRVRGGRRPSGVCGHCPGDAGWCHVRASGRGAVTCTDGTVGPAAVQSRRSGTAGHGQAPVGEDPATRGQPSGTSHGHALGGHGRERQDSLRRLAGQRRWGVAAGPWPGGAGHVDAGRVAQRRGRQREAGGLAGGLQPVRRSAHGVDRAVEGTSPGVRPGRLVSHGERGALPGRRELQDDTDDQAEHHQERQCDGQGAAVVSAGAHAPEAPHEALRRPVARKVPLGSVMERSTTTVVVPQEVTTAPAAVRQVATGAPATSCAVATLLVIELPLSQ